MSVPRSSRRSSTLTRRAFLGAAAATAFAVPGLAPHAVQAQLATGDAGSVLIETGLGRVEGLQIDGFAVFQGIPYAKPPVDDLRWVAPQPVEPWGSNVLVATQPGPVAVQVPIPFLDYDQTGEDSLYLNVWVPGTPRAGAGKPVIVFIHGGANLFGSGSEYLAPRMSAMEDVVVVTLNYRLGIFGAFSFPDLPDSGTFGLLDQHMALEWVREYIEAFGGDPGNVTLIGQSWGGLAVSAHLVSPMSEGLFHRAIIQSGVAFSDMLAGTMPGEVPEARSLWTTAEERHEVSSSLLEDLQVLDGADVVEQLRRIPAGILSAFSGRYVPYQWGTRFLPEHPVEATLAGRTHPVPVISGSTRDEARLLVTLEQLASGLFGAMGEEQYRERLDATFGEVAALVEAEYPLGDFPSPELAWATVVTDRVWALPTLVQHRAYEAAQPTWTYEFRDREAPTAQFRASGENGAGAYHSAELAYLFDVREPATLAASQRRLAASMTRYWANFARAGDPNDPDLPAWDAYDGGDLVLGLDDGPGGIAPVDFVADHRLEFWQALEASGS
jgi:para-nitrobenzyl esterase